MVQSGSPIYRILYRSFQTSSTSDTLGVVIDQIMNTAIKNNYAVGITGLLLAAKGYFFQILEGETREVCAAYARILEDPRHQELHILSQGFARKRLFGEWNMCAANLTATDRSIVSALRSHADFDPQRISAPNAERLLVAVADHQRSAMPEAYI